MDDAALTTAVEFHQRGMILRQQAQFAAAERSFLRAIELAHDHAPSHYELGRTYVDQGQFEDAADCFYLAVHFAPSLARAWTGLGGTLIQLGRMDAAEAACRKALKIDPQDAAGWMNLGNILKSRDDWDGAIECYRGAVGCDLAQAGAHCQLGYALYMAGQYARSQASFDAALALAPDMVEAHHNLGLLLLETGHADEAWHRFKRVLAINPQIIESRACLAHALRDLGRLDEAIAIYDEVLGVEPQFADAVINRGYALLMKGDFAAGWAAYERRFSIGAMVARDFPFRPWQGEPLAGKRILVYAEQGLGDEIMFASCVPDLVQHAGHCVIECNVRLAELFRRSLPRARVHGGVKSEDKRWLAGLPPVDYQIAIGSLPLYLRRSRTEFPLRDGYLIADTQRGEFWRGRFAAGQALRVGIAWRGGTLRSRQFTRSTALQQWLPLLCRDDVMFCALQHGDITAELNEIHVQSSVTVMRLEHAVDNFDELAAIISALDLVISVDNTIAHLAGALGTPVWTLLSCSPEWRYPRLASGMPWYPSMRLFHRGRSEDWETVFGRVAGALTDLARKR